MIEIGSSEHQMIAARAADRTEELIGVREIRLVVVLQRLKPLEHRFREPVIPGKGSEVRERVHPAPAVIHETKVAWALAFRCWVDEEEHVAAVGYLTVTR